MGGKHPSQNRKLWKLTAHDHNRWLDRPYSLMVYSHRLGCRVDTMLSYALTCNASVCESTVCTENTHSNILARELGATTPNETTELLRFNSWNCFNILCFTYVVVWWCIDKTQLLRSRLPSLGVGTCTSVPSALVPVRFHHQSSVGKQVYQPAGKKVQSRSALVTRFGKFTIYRRWNRIHSYARVRPLCPGKRGG